MDESMDFVQVAKIKVVGVGGGGCNAVTRMVTDGVKGVEFYCANTDAQMLKGITDVNKIVLGKDLTHGLGAGGNPEVGRKAAVEAENEIREALTGANMVFVAAGMGGGTGTGAAPIVAKIARELGALTVGVVTSPFTFEGPRRAKQAQQGLADLKENVDSIIVVSNDRLLDAIGGRPMNEAFREADNVLRQAVQTITDLIAIPAFINLGTAVTEVLESCKFHGSARMSVGRDFILDCHPVIDQQHVHEVAHLNIDSLERNLHCLLIFFQSQTDAVDCINRSRVVQNVAPFLPCFVAVVPLVEAVQHTILNILVHLGYCRCFIPDRECLQQFCSRHIVLRILFHNVICVVCFAHNFLISFDSF